MMLSLLLRQLLGLILVPTLQQVQKPKLMAKVRRVQSLTEDQPALRLRTARTVVAAVVAAAEATKSTSISSLQ